MTVTVRFAPSPTGLLHIGSARTALFNYLFAKHHNGKFLLRIEDTDKKRSTEKARQAILEGLDWLGLQYDDEIVYQSKNEKRHIQVTQELITKGMAYYCYTSAEELEQLRTQAENNGKVFCFKSPWRDKQPEKPMPNPPVIRIKAPQGGKIIINDLVQGEITVDAAELDDLVILRSDQTPTYMFAVVVDDHDMNITHIIRGDDHLTNAFRQKIIYQALNWQVPEFAHIPLIHGSDGAKMSKRHGATSVMEYKAMGYLPQTLRNYLLRLGWSHGNDEIISDDNAVAWFDLNKVGKSPARFDLDKLNNLNRHYIKESNNDELLQDIFDRIKNSSPTSKDRIKTALQFLKERSSTLKELAELAKIYQDNFSASLNAEDQKIINEKESIISEILQLLTNLPNPEWNHDGLKKAIDDYAVKNSFKFKDFGPALRICLTFSSKSGGGLFDIIAILGKEEVERRLRLTLNTKSS